MTAFRALLPHGHFPAAGPPADDLAIIDEICEDNGAPNRSALISAALDAFLPPLPE